MDFGAVGQQFELRPRRSGEIIDLAIRLLRGTFRSVILFVGPVIGLCAIPFTYGSIRTIQYAIDNSPETNGNANTAWFLFLLAAIAFAQLVTLIIMFGRHVGVPTSIRKATTISARKVLWVLVYAVVSVICFYALTIPLSIITLMITGVMTFAGPVGSVLGLVLGTAITMTISMGIVSRFHLGVIALLVENRGPIDSLKRGWNLSKKRWLLFGGIHIAVVMFSYLTIFILIMLAAYILDSFGPSMVVGLAALTVFCVMIWSLLYCAIGVAMFVDCRVRRDGLDLVMRTQEFSERITLGPTPIGQSVR